MSTTVDSRQVGTPKQASIPDHHKPSQSSSRKYKIFFVDDDLIMRKIFQRTFRQYENYELTVFPTGEACIEQLHQQPDIIVLDYHLSLFDDDAMNGLDTLKKIKEMQSEARIIMLSSQSDVGVAVDCLKRGALDYVIKDDAMKLNIRKAVGNVISSLELKQEILSLSETVKRDKLLLKGYFVVILLLVMVVGFLLMK